MKNVIKKIAAVAMAFTILGTGTAIVKTVSPQFAESTTMTASAISRGAYRVKSSFAYPISFTSYDMTTGTILDYRVDGGGFVINFTVTRGTVLELDSNGKCIRGYDAGNGRNWAGAYFGSFMGNLTRLY